MNLYEPIQIKHDRSFGLLCPACEASVGRVEFVLTQTGQVMELDCGCRLSTSVWALLCHPVRLDWVSGLGTPPAPLLIADLDDDDDHFMGPCADIPCPVQGTDTMYIYQLVDCTRPGV